MKNYDLHKLLIGLHPARFFILILVVLLIGQIDGAIMPKGTKIGALQFDAIIEINFVRNHTQTLLFARYWVAPDYYNVAVIWSEPHSNARNFSAYPPTLIINSDRQKFSVAHDVQSIYNKAYLKPIGKRGVFRYMFGDYPVTDTRFAERESLANRIYVSDLKVLRDTTNGIKNVFDVPVDFTDVKPKGSVTHLEVDSSRGLIDSIKMQDENGLLLKSISYEYEEEKNKTYLKKQTVLLPEQSIMVGFHGEGITVKTRNKKYRYKDLKLSHHHGGRKCTIEYQPIRLNDRVSTTVPLPIHIKVYDGEGKQILRSAKLFNFKQIRVDELYAKESAIQFGRFTEEQKSYRELLINYWQKDPNQVTKKDTQTIEQLRNHFQEYKAMDEGIGGRLKNLNILMELDRILGDEAHLKLHYKQYLVTLNENNLDQMMLDGGHSAIVMSMSWKRWAETNSLLDQWVDVIVVENDGESLLRFAQNQLEKGHFWTTAKMLQRLNNKYNSCSDNLFEAKGLICVALHRLSSLLFNIDSIKGKFEKAQAEWVSSFMSADELEKMLAESIADANQSFNELSNPTKDQLDLKEQLNNINSKHTKEDDH